MRLPIAQAVVRHLIDRDSIDFLGLAEVQTADLSILRSACETELQVVPATDIFGRQRTDLGVLFNPAKMQLIDRNWLSVPYQPSQIVVALKLIMQLPGPPTTIHAFLCHWPSQLHMPANDPARVVRAIALADTIRQIRSAADDPLVVIIGDFNAEPSDTPLSEYLAASRDRDLVRRRSTLLYNPFWRLLGERQVLEEEGEGRLGAGTCFYRPGRFSQWHTFDQMLFSAAFLRGNGWTLHEAEIRIWQQDPLLGPNGVPTSRFDHYPVLGAFAAEV